MLSSFIFPLLVFSIILGALWWFVRSQGGGRPTAVRAAASPRMNAASADAR